MLTRIRCPDAYSALTRIERLVPLSTDDHPRYKGIKSWIPRADYTSSIPAPVRKQDWLDAVDEYNRALLEPDTLPEFLAKKQRLAKQVAAMHTVSVPHNPNRQALIEGLR